MIIFETLALILIGASVGPALSVLFNPILRAWVEKRHAAIFVWNRVDWGVRK